MGVEGSMSPEAPRAPEAKRLTNQRIAPQPCRSPRRRGAREVEPLVGELSRVAADLAKAMGRHMAREESEVLPVLMRTLCAAEQRHMVWRILLAMPLRLLERVMPWVAGEAGGLQHQCWVAVVVVAVAWWWYGGGGALGGGVLAGRPARAGWDSARAPRVLVLAAVFSYRPGNAS